MQPQETGDLAPTRTKPYILEESKEMSDHASIQRRIDEKITGIVDDSKYKKKKKKQKPPKMINSKNYYDYSQNHY